MPNRRILCVLVMGLASACATSVSWAQTCQNPPGISIPACQNTATSGRFVEDVPGVIKGESGIPASIDLTTSGDSMMFRWRHG